MIMADDKMVGLQYLLMGLDRDLGVPSIPLTVTLDLPQTKSEQHKARYFQNCNDDRRIKHEILSFHKSACYTCPGATDTLTSLVHIAVKLSLPLLMSLC